MKKLVFGFRLAILVLLIQVAVQAQTTGSISGTVVDQAGAVVPGATVSIKGEAGEAFTSITNSSGIFSFPAITAGTPTYTVTISAPNFKTSVVQNVKVDVATPTTVNVALEAGKIDETVVITSGGEVLQTETAKIGTTIQGRQIVETPIASRDALDLVLLLPGTANVGRPRASSINGLPKGALNITVDGVDAQDNANRSTDGFFTYIRPRVDAIDEVTVSTSNPGSESGGDGAVQIRFVTRRGTNDYTGGVFWQHRNTALNSNYWYNNRDNIARQKIILNQFGGRIGGPIPFLNFGETDDWYDTGKDKRFFFFSYEQYRNPESFTRTRTVLTPAAQAGDFTYGTQMRNLYTIAAAFASDCDPVNPGVQPCVSTPDPTTAAALTRIRTATAQTGTFRAITNAAGAVTDPNRQLYSFSPSGLGLRDFLALRTDFVLTKSNSLEFVWNRQNFKPGKDFLNNRDEIFPGFPFQGQSGIRSSYTGALRSTFGNNIVNEARYAHSRGTTDFFSEQTPADYQFTRGFFLDVGTPGAITNPYNGNLTQTRSTPTHDFTDSLTWIKGNHTFNFGGQYKFIRTQQTNVNRVVPTVSFGLDSTDPLFNAFTGGATGTLPNATPAQVTEARNLYAALVARVSGYASNAYLDEAGQYRENGPLTQEFGLRTYGLFGQDSWRIRPGLILSFGLRWQPQEAFYANTGNVGRLENPSQVYGIGCEAGVFNPNASGCSAPRVVLYGIGEKAYKDDMNNFAPSAGIVWSPDFQDGFMGLIFGDGGRSVLRGGYSRAFVREGSATQTIVTNNTVGGAIALSRNTGILGSFTVGTNLRDAGNNNITTPTFSSNPSFPLALTAANQALAVDPNLTTGYVDSFSFGYQREVDRNTVVEVRYVGNRGRDLTRLNFVNETNIIENGFLAEFRAAQRNLAINVAGGCGNSFALTTCAGTVALPIMVSYFNPTATNNPNIPQGQPGSGYTATNFGSTVLIPLLSVNAANPLGFVASGSFENNAARRLNAINNGRSATFFRVNPTVPAGSFLLESNAKSWYDSAQIEVRRRLSNGLRVQASYVFSKAQSNAPTSAGGGQSNFTLRDVGIDLAKNIQPFDIRHAFKLDATYDLPMGTGRSFFGNAGGVVNALVGGFSLAPTVRIQSGSPLNFGNVQLVGITAKELEQAIGVYKNDRAVTFLPEDIILNTRRAFNLDTLGNYAVNLPGGAAGSGGAPSGRFIAPAGFGNCASRFTGDCGFTNLIVHGPAFRAFDLGINKKFSIGERRNIEFRTTILDVFNSPSFRVGGWAADVVNVGVGGATFGELGSGSAYQDLSTTNNPGGRIIDLMLRINF